MSNDIPARYSHLTDEEAGWLEEVRAPEPVSKRHRCGRCANPFTYGRPDCPNAKGTG